MDKAFRMARSLPIQPGVTPEVPVRGTYYPTPDGAIVDAGAITTYRQATHAKPQSLLRRIGREVALASQPWVDARLTTQQGSQAASPATYFQTLWPQRLEKAQYVGDCYTQYLTDQTCFKSVNMFVDEALRGGVKIRVVGCDAPGFSVEDCQDIADEYCKTIWPTEQLKGAGKTAVVGGDLYTAFYTYKDELRGFLTLPAAGMERCTDDADQFTNPDRAFAQIDTNSWSDVVYFPLWQVSHTRWNYLPGEKYGIPELMPVRRLARILMLCETAKVTQIMARAPMRYHWKIGDPENAASLQEVKDVMALNGFVEGRREIMDPAEQARDIFTNGVGDVKVLEGDQQVHQVEHLRYILDRYCNGLPTPRQLMPLGAENINRDVLKEIRAQWQLDTRRVNEAVDEPVKYGYQIQLALYNCDPHKVKFETMWTKSTTETEADRNESLCSLRDRKLISRRTAVGMLQEYTRIADVDEEIKQIEKEDKEDTELEVQKRAAGVTTGDRLADEGGMKPVRTTKKPTNGQAAARN